jgi:hypothetical protein
MLIRPGAHPTGQSNRLDTDFSSAVRFTASPRSVAIETMRI